MINVSSEFSEALYGDDRRDYIERAKITLKDNTVLNLTEENIWSGGFTIDDAVSADKIFQVGSAIVNKATLVINNIYEDYSGYDFTDAIIELSVGLELESKTEVFKKGTYIEQETKYNGSLITIEMYDYMSKFDVGYSTELPYPLRLIDILQDSCNTCGVTLATTEFPNSSTPINTKPTNATHREIISWIACMAGCYARCNADGELELKWFDVGTVEEATADGGTFNPWNTGDVLDGGTFNPWTTGDIIDAGRFSEYNVNHTITQRYSGEIAVDDVVITCVKVTVKTETGSGGESIVEHIVGTEGYAVKVENNGFITEDNAQFITNFLGNKLIGLRFRIAEISHPSDPSIEAGDIAYYFDRKGNRYVLFITRTVFTVGEPQTTSCDAETPARNSAERYSERTKNYVELRKIAESGKDSYLDDAKAYTDEQLDIYKDAVDAITDGLQDQIDQIDGKFETFYFDYEPTLQNEPAHTWVQNSEEAKHEGDIFYWKSKGYSYRFMQDNGVWSWVQIQDTDVSRAIALAQEAQATADGKRRIFVAQPTPPYDIGDLWAQGANGDILRCKTAKAEGASYDSADWERASKYTDDSALTTFINGQYSTTLQDIMGQLDEKIQTWYQETDPSTAWGTATLKADHRGDIWYCSSTTLQTYAEKTWQWNGTAWQEMKATVPADIIDKFDGMAQVFVTQPTTPYYIGDLWVQGSTGDILKCVTQRTSGDYVASDWALASKYTDDSSLTAFQNGTYATFVTQTNSDISGMQSAVASKITTFYQSSAPTATTTGDLWIDTDDGNKLYRWNGSQWVTVQDTSIQNAVTTAGEAKAIADKKILTFAQASAPTNSASDPLDTGDLWIDTDDNNKMYRWNGTQWVALSDTSALQTWINGDYASTIQSVRGQIDSKAEIWYQGNDPSTSWSATDKPNHKGDLWYKTTDGTTWVYDGSTWVEQTIPESIFDEIDGKAQIFVGSTTPVDPNSGDLWFRSANDPILTYVNGNWIEYNNYANASGIEELLMEEVGKIQIGGTNLLRNTQDYFYTGLLDLEGCLYSQNCVLRGHYRECAIAEYDNTELSALGDMLAWHNVMVDLSTTYTLSFWGKADTITDPTLYAYFYGEIGYPEVAKGVSSEGTTNTNTDGLMPFTLTSDWKRYWVKWTIADQGDVEIGKWVLFRAAALSNVSVAGVKLEKGSIATYYSPSPTDVDDTISRLLESSKYGICETSADVQEKYVELVNFNLDVGTQFAVTFVNGNESERVMLDVNGTGAKFVTIENDIDLGRKMIFPSGTTASFVYDGSTYRFVASDNLYNLINWSAEAGLDIRAEEGSLSRVNINNQSVDVYDSNGNLGTSTSSDGFDVYKNGTLIASFGERTVLGEKDVGTRIELSKSAIEFFEKTIRTAYLAEDKFYFINGEVTQSLFFPDYSVREDTNQDLVISKR